MTMIIEHKAATSCQHKSSAIKTSEKLKRARHARAVTLVLLSSGLIIIINQIVSSTHAYEDSNTQILAGPLWLNTNDNLKQSDQDDSPLKISAKLDELLNRTGPNMRASSDYRDFQDLKLNETLEAWRLMHEQAKYLAESQVRHIRPKLRQILIESNVSSSCVSASEQVLSSIERLDSWAVQMWTYSGSFPPGGFLDGQLTDVGHYRSCVDIVHPADSSKHPASYCVVGFRPVVPSRKRFHLVFEKEPRELLELFNSSDFLASVAHKSQYFHYLYLKTGLCVPSECSASDMQQVAKTVGRKFALMSAPVKCFTRSAQSQSTQDLQKSSDHDDLENLENNEPVLVDLNQKMNKRQLVSLVLIVSFFSIVFLVTIWHGLELAWQGLSSKSTYWTEDEFSDETSRDIEASKHNDKLRNGDRHKLSASDKAQQFEQVTTTKVEQCNSLKTTAFHYFSMITNGREFLDTSMRSSEIKCLHGLRTFSMIWIICVHTLQYNEWSGFTRVFENVASFQHPLVHPMINANYVVDNFFLMSGLLAAYTAWYSNKGGSSNFSAATSLLGRYLRLTPQALLISLLYIVLPLLTGGPFWYDMTHYPSKYCEKNWWVNLLHVQAFYRKDEMCNLVGWWISVDMFYYVLGLALLWMILNKRVQLALVCTSFYVTYCTIITAWRHYTNGFSPNNLGLVPQIQEVWRDYVVDFYWSPAPHAFVFFVGFWLGYVLANKLGVHHVRRWSRLGWFCSLATLFVINFSSRLWTTGVLDLNPEHQYISTTYNTVCVIGWACSFGWMIVACHYGCAQTLDKLLSTPMSVMLSKASFIIYLSHMLVLRIYFGSRYNLLEVSIGSISLFMVGLIFFSILFGVFLCVAFEAPCLKFQKLILRTIKTERKLPLAGSSYHVEMSVNNNSSGTNDEKETLSLGPTSVTLLK